ncbi:hypothetical protein CTI12_AA382310 [Artemisia annua]|uniref:Reverse transcriptase zinc-binding domain-containing protein n=1 Tax=Artemisia annua TaxID=35608 RepID=A0A2U1MHM3_ARTAN|nr:hypothetical protein CTI12_AA382310 [Artemisia annua]
MGPTTVEIRWNKNLSIKINIHSWRFSIDRLPTKFNLDARGIDLDTVRCPICDEDIETSQNLFLDCIIAKSLFSMVSSWWAIQDYPKDMEIFLPEHTRVTLILLSTHSSSNLDTFINALINDLN